MYCAGSKKSNLEQVLDQRRKSSVPQTSSSLAKATSIDESHTVSTEDKDPSTSKTTAPPSADKDAINQREKAIAEEDDDDGEARDEPVKKAAKVSATDTGEERVLGGTNPQEGEAADGEAAGESVGD